MKVCARATCQTCWQASMVVVPIIACKPCHRLLTDCISSVSLLCRAGSHFYVEAEDTDLAKELFKPWKGLLNSFNRSYGTFSSRYPPLQRLTAYAKFTAVALSFQARSKAVCNRLMQGSESVAGLTLYPNSVASRVSHREGDIRLA